MSDCRYHPNKMQFLSECEAKEYLKCLPIDGSRKKQKLNAYLCPSCHRWHLTRYSKAAQRRIAKSMG